MRDYPPFALTHPDRRDWIFSAVLERKARTAPDRPFLQYMEEPALTYGEVDLRVNRLANAFLAQGVRRGDRVLVMLPTSIEFMLVWWALNRIGAIHVPVNNAYKGPFLEHVVNNAGARVMVVARELVEHVEASHAKIPHLTTLIVWTRVGPSSPPAPPVGRFRLVAFDEFCDGPDEPPSLPLSYRDVSAIMYTSGTTGPSKGVMMPNAHCHFFAECVVNLTHLTEDDVYFVAAPLYHGNAPLMQVYPALLVGGKAVLWPRFSASEWAAQIRRTRATVTTLLGVMMDFVFRQPARPDDRDHRLRLVLGQPAPASIVGAFKERFGIARVLEYYGMTEIALVTMMPYDEARPGSCGLALSEWFDLRIADPETDEEVAAGAVGELLVRPRASWVFNQGYWSMPDKTLDARRNLWFHTGDAMRRDADGYYFFVDRIDDRIRRRAVNVSSFEVEAVIAEHPAVLECAVVAVPADFAGGEDEIKACLVLRDGQTLVPEALLEWCESRLPHFAVPRYLDVLCAVPKTASNKVQKYLLRKDGVGPGTWDRVRAGYHLQEERRKAARRTQQPGIGLSH